MKEFEGEMDTDIEEDEERENTEVGFAHSSRLNSYNFPSKTYNFNLNILAKSY